MCGAAVPKITPPPQETTVTKSDSGGSKHAIWAIAIIAIVVIVGAFFLLSDPDGSPATTTSVTVPVTGVGSAQPVSPQGTPAQGGQGAGTVNRADAEPYELITDPGLRQALELAFRREMRQISWDEINQIRTISIEREAMVISNEIIPLNELATSSYATRVQTDAALQDANQLWLFENLTVFSIAGSLGSNVLERLPNIIELSVQASNSTPDFSHVTVLPNLQRLEVSGRALDGLAGLSELNSLYALRLTSTGISDLSVLSLQENIVELALVDNRELGSFDTLKNMTWLRSLHIERSEDRSLAFINEMTNLEALTIIRSGTRTYEFILPLTNLTYLRLQDNREVNNIPSLAGFSNLVELHLDTGRNTGTVRPTDYLVGLSSVRIMTLNNPDTLNGLQGMTNLEELNISLGWLLTDAAPLGSLTNLQRLNIYNSRTFNSEVQNMSAIGQLSSLRELNISDNELFFNWNFLFDLTSLERLNISDSNVIGNFERIGRLTNLRELRMDNIRPMTGYQISRSGGMVSIWFDGEAPVQDLVSNLTNLTNLEILSMSNNNISDISFASYLSNLRILNLENNFVADISPLTELASLETVDLRRNAVIDWSPVNQLINTTFLGR